MGSTEVFAAKFGEAGSLSETAHPADVLATSTPTWLLQDGAAASGSTEDVMDEFLTDDDMLRLEVECLKWYDLSDKDLKAIGKLDEKMATKILDCHKDMSTFLRYRQQLNEKHARKASVKINMRRKTIMGSEDVQTIAEEEGEEEEEDREHPEDEESHEPKETRGIDSASGASKDSRATKSDPLSARAYRKRSVVANNRRMSVSAKLARAGTQISCTSEEDMSPTSQASARGRRPTIADTSYNQSSGSDQSAAIKGRRSVFGKQAVPMARRMSLAANKAQSESADSAGGGPGPSGKKGPADFKSNQSQGSESSGTGQEKARMSRLGTRTKF